MARRGRGIAVDRAADRAAAPDGVEGAPNGVEPPGARTMGAIAVARWAARGPGDVSEGPDEGGTPLTQGPYDDGDLDPEHIEADRVDFGAVRIPVPRDGQVSVEPEAGRLQAVHVMLPTGRLSVSALAAPRSARLWPELAAEIDESLREGGATVRSFTGPWGRELHARTGEASSVFVGVDGPRWMLYGVATGPTGAARELDSALRRMLRGVVVVRGRAPYPVRTVLPLTVPEHLAAADPEAAEPEQAPPARNGRFARRPAAPARSGPAGPPELPARPRGAAAQVPPPSAVRAPLSVPPSVPDPGGVPTEPHGLRRVASLGTNGHADGRPSRLGGATAHRPHPDPDAGAALRPPPENRDPLPTVNGRPPAERPDQDPSSTGQRRVADLLAEAQRERAALEARARAVAPPPAAYRPDRAPAEPVPPGPGLLGGSPPAAAGGPYGGTVNGRGHDPYDHRNHDPRNGDRRDDRWDDIAPLRLGGAPRVLGSGGSGVEARYDPERPAAGRWSDSTARSAPDGSDDWTLPMSVVAPRPDREQPEREIEAPQGRPGDDLWAGDPWAAEARAAARVGRAAELRQERPPAPDERGPGGRGPDGRGPDGRGRGAPDPEWSEHHGSGHHRSAHHRASHHRPAHERPGGLPPVDVPAARVPPPVPPAWAHVRDDRGDYWADDRADRRADPYGEPPSGRHRRPER